MSSKLESDLAFAIKAAGLTEPVRQLHPFWCCECRKGLHYGGYCDGCFATRWHDYEKTRNWAVDFAWPGRRLIVEVEGGVYTQGRHTRPAGFIKDVEKYNALTLAGWTLIRFTRREVNSGEALNQIERALKEAS